MRIPYYIIGIYLVFLSLSVSCSDTQTYADLVEDEENSIGHLLTTENLQVRSIDEETMEDWTDKVLEDSINPSSLIALNQWYTVTEGDFKRLYFKIKSWGTNHQRWEQWQAYKDSLTSGLKPRVKADSVSFYEQKIVSGSYVMVRYDSMYVMSDTLDIHTHTPIDNLDPYSYEIIYGWSEAYYASSYYSYYYGSSSSYACTSGGIAFPLRFLWYDAEVSLIVPFSLVSSTYSSSYSTLYYGKVKYTKPNYLPED